MKQFNKWIRPIIGAEIVCVLLIVFLLTQSDIRGAISLLFFAMLVGIPIFGLIRNIRQYGIKTEMDISRVLGKDAKDALSFGNVGILTYNNEYIVTWASDFFLNRGLDLTNKKLTSWIENIRELFDEDLDVITGSWNQQIFEIQKKSDAQILFVKDITEVNALRKEVASNSIVVGLAQLDNYMEYQSYENEELIAHINTQLRTPVVQWAQDNGILIRRLRSDRFILIMNKKLLESISHENFSILQAIKDKATNIGVSITLSMCFAYGTNDLRELDATINDLIEIAQSRGGDQAVIKDINGPIQYVGGNSEMSSTRSKVRVRIIAQTIQDALNESDSVYIAGHIMTDFDCMGACLAVSSWANTLHKKVYIVLKDVSRDQQLQDVVDHYIHVLKDRHVFITPEQAMDQMNPDKDLLVMLDHGLPAISSGKDLIDLFHRIVVVDHHRRGENFVKNAILTYVESTASSTCELIVELLQNVPGHIPIFEAEATIMYLGILVDTNRFKMHTDARTFEAAASLHTWGANIKLAEKALCEDYMDFTQKHHLIQMAQPYMDRFMIVCDSTGNYDKTILAQVSDALLMIRGCKASFTISRSNESSSPTCCSARSDGSFNVQKIMEALGGGGHFSAAAVSNVSVDPEELKKLLMDVIKEEVQRENHSA